MTSVSNAMGERPGRLAAVSREINTLLLAAIVAIAAFVVFRSAAPQIAAADARDFMDRFMGFSWAFFVVVTAFLLYATGAWMAAVFGLGAPRRWERIGHALHWAAEACPLVGLLTTFLSLLTALLAYGEAGPGSPDTQAAFISQFAIAFGSSIAGGVLALIAFTLHRVLPEDTAEDQ
jgi:hypothetical protein